MEGRKITTILAALLRVKDEDEDDKLRTCQQCISKVIAEGNISAFTFEAFKNLTLRQVLDNVTIGDIIEMSDKLNS